MISAYLHGKYEDTKNQIKLSKSNQQNKKSNQHLTKNCNFYLEEKVTVTFSEENKFLNK